MTVQQLHDRLAQFIEEGHGDKQVWMEVQSLPEPYDTEAAVAADPVRALCNDDTDNTVILS